MVSFQPISFLPRPEYVRRSETHCTPLLDLSETLQRRNGRKGIGIFESNVRTDRT